MTGESMDTQAPATILIEPFRPEHVGQVVRLIVGIQQNEFNLPITAKDQPDLQDIPEFYQVKNGNFWVALQESRVVGTIALLDIGNRTGALRKMFVNARCRGKETGTAKKLLDALLAWAARKEFTAIYLGTTPKFLAAHAFYERNGFQEVAKSDLPSAFPIMKVDTKFYAYKVNTRQHKEESCRSST